MPPTKTKTRTVNDNTSFHYSFAAGDAVVLSPATASSVSGAALPKGTYRVVSTVDCWIKTATTGAGAAAAVATAGCMYVPAKTPLMLQLSGAEFVGCIRDGASDGKLSLVRVD